VASGDVRGWGELRSSRPRTEAAAGVVAELGRSIIGGRIGAPTELPVRLRQERSAGGHVHATASAAAALEAAAWDLYARRAGVSLVEALGIAPREVLRSVTVRRFGEVVGVQPTPAPHAAATVIEIGPLQDRSVVPMGATAGPLILDCGGRYTRAYAEALQAVSNGASLVVEPFPDGDLVQTARLRRGLSAPVAVPAVSFEHTEAALTARACDCVSLDPGLMGITESTRILEYVHERGRSAWVRSSATSQVGLASDVVVAMHPAAIWPMDAPAETGWPAASAYGVGPPILDDEPVGELLVELRAAEDS
jgi:L-alanine-DL-glutamate epimerase-like enolase superfamily enzyme